MNTSRAPCGDVARSFGMRQVPVAVVTTSLRFAGQDRLTAWCVSLQMRITPALLLVGLVGLGCGPKPGIALKTDPGLVEFEVSLGNRYLPADVGGEVIARLRVMSRSFDRRRRPPANVALVIDTSSSMQGKAIADARAAALTFVDLLADGDRLSVVSFGSGAELLVPSTMLDRKSRVAIAERIGAMSARGTTDLNAGLATGLGQVQGGFLAEGVNRIVLLGDGVPNDPAPIIPLAQAARSQGVSITVLGLGIEYDEVLLGSIAQHSGGKFHYVESSDALAGFFREEVLRLDRAIASNMTLILTPGPGVEIAQAIGVPMAAVDARRVQLQLGDLGEGEQRDVVLRLRVGAHREGAAVELADAVLSFDDLVARAGRFERRSFLEVRAITNAQAIEDGRNAEVELWLARAAAAGAILEVIALARSGQRPQAEALLEKAAAKARADAKRTGDAELRALADEMVSLREALPSLVVQTPQVNPQQANFEVSPDSEHKVRKAYSAAAESLQQ